MSEDTRRPIRLAHLVSHPVAYFAPLYRELARRSDVDLTVFFYSAATLTPYFDREFGGVVEWTDAGLVDGYRSVLLPSARERGVYGPLASIPQWDIVRAVYGGHFDAVWINGYAHSTSWAAVAAARHAGSEVFVRDEQTLLHDRAWPKRALKSLALRWLCRRASVLYIGENNRRYFAAYGALEERMFPARYCVDNAWFTERAGALRPQRQVLRQRFGLDQDSPVILFVGKLIPKKQPLHLLEAFAKVRREHPCQLLYVGDGPQRAELERAVRDGGIQDVAVAGFLAQTDLPAAYTVADVFVLPSAYHETWGLVVNEAMNFRLPVVVTDKVGCAPDLVRVGENGMVVPHDDVHALAGALATLVADGPLRTAYGANSAVLVAHYSIEACADGIVAACEARVGANDGRR